MHFGVEVRAFVLDHRVVTHSAYLRDGDIARVDDGTWPLRDEERDGALQLLTALCQDPSVPLPPAVVIDVGHIEGRGWAVVEANAAWAALVCGCDPAAVLRVIARPSVPVGNITHDQRRWVRTPSLTIE